MKKVLVIEDNEDNFEVIEGYLEEAYELFYAKDGESGLASLERCEPDVVLLDISLPKMDGEEVLAKIREEERWKGLPVIALTAHAMRGDRERFLQLGFDDYMSKPIVDPDYLLEAIERVTERQNDA